MKRSKIVLVAILVMLLSACCDKPQKLEIMNTGIEPVMGLGEPISANFTGDAWLKMLSTEPGYDCNVYNVTFAPGTRNYWHSHSIGQILLCTEGVGYYQEMGQPARRLVVGDVVNIPANTMHWHGAATDSRFTHIGITPRVNENATTWGEPVSDEAYEQATK